jgi:hypothetical protein
MVMWCLLLDFGLELEWSSSRFVLCSIESSVYLNIKIRAFQSHHISPLLFFSSVLPPALTIFWV